MLDEKKIVFMDYIPGGEWQVQFVVVTKSVTQRKSFIV